jgi:HEAT repeat protein
VQEEAARSLGKLGDKRAVEPLILALKSTEFDSVVAAVTNSLGRLGDNRAVNPIVSYLREKGTIAKDEKSITAGESHALLALGRIGSPEAIAFLLSGASARRARSPQQNMAGSLAPRGDALAIRDLVSAYKVTSGSIRVAITAAIEGEKDPRAFDALLTALRSGDPELGGAAAVALGRTGDHRAFDTLVAVFKEQSEPVSAKAAEGLGQLKDPRAVEPLMVAVREFLNGATHSGSFILSCVEALGELRDPRAVDTLVSVLEKWTLGPALAEEAVRSLGKTKDPAAIQALNAAKKSDRPEVVAAARRELAEIDEVGE